MAKQFTQVIGAALLVVGILGFFVKESLGFLHLTVGAFFSPKKSCG